MTKKQFRINGANTLLLLIVASALIYFSGAHLVFFAAIEPLTLAEPTKTSCVAGGGAWIAGTEIYNVNTFTGNKAAEHYYFEGGKHINYTPVSITLLKESVVKNATVTITGEKIVVSDECLTETSCTAPEIVTQDYNCEYQAVGRIGAGISSQHCNFFGSIICYGEYCSSGKVHTEYYTAVIGGSSCEVRISNGCVWGEQICYGNPVSCEQGQVVSNVQTTNVGCTECSWSSHGGYSYNCGGCGTISRRPPMLYMKWNYSSYIHAPTVKAGNAEIMSVPGELSTGVTADITEQLNAAISTCIPVNGYCSIPISTSAIGSGTIVFNALDIETADNICKCFNDTYWTGIACRPYDEEHTDYLTPEETNKNLCIETNGTWNGNCTCPTPYIVTDGYYIQNSECTPYEREISYYWSSAAGCKKDTGEIVYLPYSNQGSCLQAVAEGKTTDPVLPIEDTERVVYDEPTDTYILEGPPDGILFKIKNIFKLIRRFFS